MFMIEHHDGSPLDAHGPGVLPGLQGPSHHLARGPHDRRQLLLPDRLFFPGFGDGGHLFLPRWKRLSAYQQDRRLSFAQDALCYAAQDEAPQPAAPM